MDPKLVLPWLLTAIAAPAFIIGWLVPIRESLALLPQMLVSYRTRPYKVRKYFWSAGCVIQGVSVILMGLLPLISQGTVAGLFLLGLLSLFSLARCLCSVIIKDVQGKTIDKQSRGGVSGLATSIAGICTIAVALGLMFNGLNNEWALTAILLGAGILWFAASVVYLRLREYPDASPTTEPKQPLSKQLFSPFKEQHLRQFILTRCLFLSTALAGPFYVVLANQSSAGQITVLGSLLLLAGLATLVSGNIWGRFSDYSSKTVLTLSGALCGTIAILVVMSLHFQWPIGQSPYWYGAAIFLLYVGHTGVRQGRTTYLIDMANGDNRSQWVAFSNTVIGIVLLLVGGIVAFIGKDSIQITLLILGTISIIAAVAASRLPEVSR